MLHVLDSNYHVPVETQQHRVSIDVVPALVNRNRLTCGFRLPLAIPHLVLVGGPAAFALTVGWREGTGLTSSWGASAGLLGAVAAVAALIAWFAILFTGEYPEGLRALVVYYLRWRVRASAYAALLRDEYPPFGESVYPAWLSVRFPRNERNRLSVALRPVLAIPHIIVVWALGMAWMVTTMIAWLNIVFTGAYPPALYRFGVGVLRWTTRVEAYVLLLHDDYPPFSLE
jgi:uncharacterized protein DUF4389